MAGSSTSTRFVAAITMMPSLTPKPSISTSSWFKVCSLSSWLPPIPVPRRLATASISSIKIIHGLCFLPSANRSRTRDAPTPTNISTKSEPDILKNGTPASPAIAFAIRVLPVPGGPTSSTPFGIRAPTLVYLEGFFRKSTISFKSSFSSSSPATCSKVIFLSLSSESFARLLPKFIIDILPPPLPADRFINIIMTTTTTSDRSTGRIILLRMLSPGTSSSIYWTLLSCKSCSTSLTSLT